MHPRLFEIPFVHLTLWSFGLMMVLGFLAALLLVRRLSRRAGLDAEVLSNAALYSLIVGVVGARTFFVIHYFEQFRDDLPSVLAIWHGGLEFIGGVVPAVAFLLFYLHRRKLPIRRYLDIMAMGLMLGLAFGRIGCFLNGCCFGKPATLPWSVRFPYRSYAYVRQINPDPERDRAEPRLPLPPSEYLDFLAVDGTWYPKPLEELSESQRRQVTEGQYRCLPVHPTQLYASALALLICGTMYVFWRRSLGERRGRFSRPGMAVAALCILYGIGRFFLESIRDDNPYEFGTLTISQILTIAMFVAGIVFLGVLVSTQSDAPGRRRAQA